MEAHPGWLYLRKETEEASGGRRRTREGDAGVSVYGGSFSFRVICGSLVVRIDAASRPITIHRTTITPLGYIPTRRILVSPSYALSISPSHVRVPSSLRPRLPLRRPSSSIPALLQIARRTYPLRLRKIARDLNYYALLFFLSLSLSSSSSRARITICYSTGRDSNYLANYGLLFIGCSHIEYIRVVISFTILNAVAKCAARPCPPFVSLSLSFLPSLFCRSLSSTFVSPRALS